MADPSTDNDVLDVSNAVVRFTNQVEPVDGDFDLDGDVDFVDFLNFAGNFGPSGPVPTSSSSSEPIIITLRDTIIKTVADTGVQLAQAIQSEAVDNTGNKVEETETGWLVSPGAGIDMGKFGVGANFNVSNNSWQWFGIRVFYQFGGE